MPLPHRLLTAADAPRLGFRPGILRGSPAALREAALARHPTPWLTWQNGLAAAGLVAAGAGIGFLIRKWWLKPRTKVSGYDYLLGSDVLSAR